MVRLTDRPDMTLVVYRGRKTTTQQFLQIRLLRYKSSRCALCSRTQTKGYREAFIKQHARFILQISLHVMTFLITLRNNSFSD